MTVRVHHWRFEDGITCPNPDNQFPLDPVPRGWYCWAYPDERYEFEDWMKINCPTADITHKFNSGDPMTQVYIKDDEEATSFKLQWM